MVMIGRLHLLAHTSEHNKVTTPRPEILHHILERIFGELHFALLICNVANGWLVDIELSRFKDRLSSLELLNICLALVLSEQVAHTLHPLIPLGLTFVFKRVAVREQIEACLYHLHKVLINFEVLSLAIELNVFCHLTQLKVCVLRYANKRQRLQMQ